MTWRHSTDKTRQLRILSQSVLLEEARTPYLIRASMLLISFAFLGFIFWASITRIKELARTSGEIIPSGYVQTVQHLEGGIVGEILVHDDDVVQAGQVLLRMRGDNLLGDFERISTKQELLSQRAARLRAFLDNAALPPPSEQEGEGKTAVVGQREILEGMIAALVQEEQVLKRQLEQKRGQLTGLEQEIVTAEKTLAISTTSFNNQAELYRERLVPEITYLAALKDKNEQQGRVESLRSRLAQTRAAINEQEARLRSLHSASRDNVLQKLGAIEEERAENREVLDKLQHQVERLEVRAPISGVAKGLEVHTVGGVVAPGSRLLEIVPTDRTLLAEIKISPTDIGHLKVGFPAIVKITSFDFSRYGAIDGTVTSLSATTFSDTKGLTYYKGLIRLSRNHVGNNPGENLIQPGMIVNADIITGDKSLLAYLLKPIHLSMTSSFGER